MVHLISGMNEVLVVKFRFNRRTFLQIFCNLKFSFWIYSQVRKVEDLAT